MAEAIPKGGSDQRERLRSGQGARQGRLVTHFAILYKEE